MTGRAVARVIVAAAAWLALATSAHAQPLTISDEIVPVSSGRIARSDPPLLRPAGEGFAIDGVATFDGALAPVDRPAYLDACLPTAIGATTCVRSDMRRMSLADGTVLDAEPFAFALRGTFAGAPMIAAHGDDYLVVLATGDLRVWRASQGTGLADLVPTYCPLCYVRAIACAPRGCSALIASGSSDGLVTLFRVDVGPMPRLGRSLLIGASHAYTIAALDDQWALANRLDWLDFYDDALGDLGSTPIPSGATLACVHDACLVVEVPGAVSRCASGSCAPFGSLPPLAVGSSRWLTCGTESCGVLTASPPTVHVGGLSGRDGASVDLTDAYWSRDADQSGPSVVMTPAGPLLAYTDRRGPVGSRAAIATIAAGETHEPIFADDDVTPAPTTIGGFVASASGALMRRIDAAAAPASGATWIRVSPSAEPLGVFRDPFGCPGPFASGSHGIEQACLSGAGTLLEHLADEGRLDGPAHGLPLLAPVALAVGDTQALVTDAAGMAVLVELPDGAIGPRVDLRALLSPFGALAAAGAARFLVASPGFGGGVVAAIVDEDGNALALGEPIAARSAVSTASEPAVAFDGSTFIVVWIERTDGHPSTLMLRRVRADGRIEPDTHVIASFLPAAYGIEDAPALASDGAGRSVVAYVHTEAGATNAYTVSSIRAREIRTIAPIGTPCTDDAECGSGLCADGVCCATPCDWACFACSVAAGARIDGVCSRTCPASVASDAGSGHTIGTDAGVRDGGAARDGGSGLHPLRGCACSAGRGASPQLLGALVVVFTVLCGARRRSRSVAAARGAHSGGSSPCSRSASSSSSPRTS